MTEVKPPLVDVYREVLEREQECLWNDLNLDLRMANNSYWSIACESRVQRIIWIARVIGFTEWEKIQIPLLSSRIYEAVLAKLDIAPPEMDLGDLKLRSDYPPTWSLTRLRIHEMKLD